MKKLILCLLILCALSPLAGCGQKKCFTCGEPITGKKYEIMGNSFHEDCVWK